MHDAESPFPSKFIVSGEADRAAVWRTMLSYGAKGDAWFDSLQAGGSPGALVSKMQLFSLYGAGQHPPDGWQHYWSRMEAWLKG